MLKEIIVINGPAESGKDTFIELVNKYAKVINFSTIDKIKEIAKQRGWDGKKTEKDRKFLSDLKKLTTEYNDMAFKNTELAIKDFYQSDNEILFIHIREPEEINRVVKQFKALTLFLKRDSIEIIKSNSSDANVGNYQYDYVINNSTSEKLDEQALHFVLKLKDGIGV